MYVLPSDGIDEFLDTNGAIDRAIASISYWLTSQTGGLDLRWDTYNGQLDITFYRLSVNEATVTLLNAFVRDLLEAQLRAAGVVSSAKQYAVFYGGDSNWSCGGGAWPPLLNGVVSAIYLKGTPPNAPACATNSFGSSTTAPLYFEIAMLHEILHSIGLVPTCSPNQHLNGHVSDSPNDLMWSGNAPWQLPPTLDIGNDDYFQHGNSGCPDLARSGYIDPLPANYWLPEGVDQ